MLGIGGCICHGVSAGCAYGIPISDIMRAFCIKRIRADDGNATELGILCGTHGVAGFAAADRDVGRLFCAAGNGAGAVGGETAALAAAFARHCVGADLYLSVLLHAGVGLFYRGRDAAVGCRRIQPFVCGGGNCVFAVVFRGLPVVFEAV